jgi:hypothetical protein
MQPIKDIKDLISGFLEDIKQQLPYIEAETAALITRREQDSNVIERQLDNLLSLTDLGIADDIYVRLLEYYKTVDAEGAAFYWKEYDKEENVRTGF